MLGFFVLHVEVVSSMPLLSQENNLLLMGSCFASEMGQRLAAAKFRCDAVSYTHLDVYKRQRQDIIKEVSCNPGHFAASLGTVELTVALHYVFNTPYDRIGWDVGHQAYGHKILTGRREAFSTNRKLDVYKRQTLARYFQRMGVGNCWEMAFIVIGGLGFIWMGLWIFMYKKPDRCV